MVCVLFVPDRCLRALSPVRVRFEESGPKPAPLERIHALSPNRCTKFVCHQQKVMPCPQQIRALSPVHLVRLPPTN